jgi:hypothetical protein
VPDDPGDLPNDAAVLALGKAHCSFGPHGAAATGVRGGGDYGELVMMMN